VLKKKYGRWRVGVNIFHATSRDSPLWKGITENNQVIQPGVGFTIGDGRNTTFWTHKWAAETSLIDLAHQPIPEAL